MKNFSKWFWATLRIMMGWLFFWPFLDKMYGLSFSTPPGSGWIDGGSPTFGFLTFGTKGPFTEFFSGMAGNPILDWIFMVGLLMIGVALLLGIGLRAAGWTGALMLVLMYLAGFIPPEHNPLIDDHIVYAWLMIGIAMHPADECLSLGKWWSGTKIVKKLPFLR
jgi:thiosulfate dehydrogenase [quinone] large subunit